MAKTKLLSDILAQELGYKDSKELKAKIKRGETGGFHSRLESGQGIVEAFKGSVGEKVGDVKKLLTKQGLKKSAGKLGKRLLLESVSGSPLISSYVKGRFNKRTQEDLGQEEESKSKPEGLGGEESVVLLKIIAKNSVALPWIARDMNVMRQNIIKMVKIENDKSENEEEGDKKSKSPKPVKHEAVNKADAWFMREDEREAKLETERAKFGKKEQTKTPQPEKPKEEGGGLLESIIGMFSGALMSGISAIFNPGVILKLLGKVFVIGAIFISLFKGFTAAWEKWKETGSLKDAIIAGLGAILDFLTFGLFGEDSVKKLFQAVEDFIDPIIDSVKDAINSIKDWVANNIGIPEIKFKIPVIGKEVTVGPWYPFKDNPKSAENQVTPKNSKSAEQKETKVPTGGTAPAEGNERDKAEKQLGVVRDPITGIPSYKGVKFFDPTDTKELKSVIDAIDSGKEGFEYKTFDSATGQEVKRKLSIKPTPTKSTTQETPSAAPTPVVASGGAVSSTPSGQPAATAAAAPSSSPTESSEKGTSGAGSSGPEPTTSAPSGESLSKESSDVAEQQRMESAADMGSFTDNSIVTNTKQTTSSTQPSISDAWDTTFLEFYAAT